MAINVEVLCRYSIIVLLNNGKTKYLSTSEPKHISSLKQKYCLLRAVSTQQKGTKPRVWNWSGLELLFGIVQVYVKNLKFLFSDG